MGYGRTPRTIAKVKNLLDEMVESDKSIEWLFDDPQKTAYKIWEGIRFSIRSGKEEFKKYSILLNKYKIKIIDPDIVKAEIRTSPVISPNGLIIREINDVLGAIGAAIEYKKDKLVFPEINGDEMGELDKEILSNWCNDNSYNFNITPTRLELTRKDG